MAGRLSGQRQTLARRARRRDQAAALRRALAGGDDAGRPDCPAGRARDYGLPIALYTDRAGWAFHTPSAGGPRGSHPPHRGRPDPRPPGHRAHPELLSAGPRPRRAAEPHAPGPPRERAPRRRDHDARGGERLPARASSSPTTTASSPARRPIPRVPSSHSAWPWTSISSSPRTGERLVGRDNVVSFEGLALQLAKQRGPAELHGLARHGAAASHRRAHRLARSAVPGPLRRPGPARWTAPAPDAPKRPPAARPRPVRPPARRTPARMWLRTQRFEAGHTGISPRWRRLRAAAAARGCRSAPESKRTDYVSKPSGHFIC